VIARWSVLIAATLLAAGAHAQDMVTEVVPAGFRSADELARILRPLVPPPGSVNGFHNQLVIKTTPDNLAELRRILATLDTAPANLLVTVRRTLDAQVSRDLAQGSVRLGSDNAAFAAGRETLGGGGASAGVVHGRAAAGVRVERQTGTRQGTDVQSLRVLEGKEAFIHMGQSVPVGERSVVITGAGVAVAEGTRYEEFGTGFFVRPRLHGDTVILDIIPSSRELRGDGSGAVREASTSISGPLGRWMEIGAADAQSTRGRSSVGSSRTTTTQRNDAIYVKVERLD
jgi:type II secretory pathway component GspD/PulD (secretin)